MSDHSPDLSPDLSNIAAAYDLVALPGVTNLQTSSYLDVNAVVNTATRPRPKSFTKYSGSPYFTARVFSSSSSVKRAASQNGVAPTSSGAKFQSSDDRRVGEHLPGHRLAADALLQQVAHRMRATVRDTDFIARLGGGRGQERGAADGGPPRDRALDRSRRSG